MRGFGAQKLDDLAQPILRAALRRRMVLISDDGQSTVEFDERAGDIRQLQHQIHRACRDRAARHAVISRLGGVLRDDKAAFLLHGFQPEAAVRPGARQDDADGARTDLPRHGAQQKIKRQARAVARLRLGEAQDAAFNGQILSRRNDIQVIALNRHALGGLPHVEPCVTGQQIDQQALMRGIKMLDEDESHAGADRQDIQQPAEGLKAPRRCAYCDDKGSSGLRMHSPRQRRAATRRGPSDLNRSRMA